MKEYEQEFWKNTDGNSSLVGLLVEERLILKYLRNLSRMSLTEAGNVVTRVALVALILITAVGNVLVILAWCTRRALRTPQNGYIVSLAVSDLLVGLIVLPIDVLISFDVTWTNHLYMTKARFVIVKTLCTVSIFHLIGIAWDRYRTVVYELEYLRRRTMSSVVRTIIAIWILAFWIAYQPVLLTLLHSDVKLDVSQYGLWVLPSSVNSFVMPTLLMLFMYIEVFKAIRERLRVRRVKTGCTGGRVVERNSSFEMTSDSMTMVTTTKPLCLAKEEGRSGRRFRLTSSKLKISLSRERTAAKTLLIIIGVFLFCWLPSYSFQFVCGVFQEVNKQESHKYVIRILEYFGHANSAINPFIYSYYNADFRKAFRALLRFKESRSSVCVL